MYNRMDYRKGRYVSYDYEPKGDRFTRGLSETPRVFSTVTRYESGRTFKRRVRTTELPSVTVADLFSGKLLKTVKERVEQGNDEVFLSYKDGRLQVNFEPPGTHVGLELSEQHKGKRLWLVCPGCERRAGRLYVHKRDYLNIWGCQKCFGLSYPGQYAHRTQALDRAIVKRRVKVSFKVWLNASEREHRRWAKIATRFNLFSEVPE